MVRFLLLTLCCIYLSDSFGQTRKYAAQRLTEDDGLSQNFIYTLTEDERGFLWTGTGSGLSRYDGDEVRNFFLKDGLSADFITADFRTSGGDLVFGHYQGGLTRFDGLTFKTILPDTLGNKVVGIAEDSGKNLWVATQTHGLFYLLADRSEVIPVPSPDLAGQVIQVISLVEDNLWVGTQEGLFLFNVHNRELRQVKHEVLPLYTSVTSLLPHQSATSAMWVGTAAEGVFLLEYRRELKGLRLNKAFQQPEIARAVIQSMAEDADGDLWLGTRQRGVLHLNIGRDRRSVFEISSFNKSTGFPLTSVNKLLIDKQGQVWAGTMGDGLVRIYKELFTYFSFADNYGVEEVRAIAETPMGYLVATDNGLLKITLNQQSDAYAVADVALFAEQSVLSVYADSRNEVWVATERKGVFVLKPEGTLEPVRLEAGNSPIEVRLFEEDLKGNMWLSAKAQGVYQLDSAKRVVRHLTTANRFIHNDIFAIKADSRGNMWFGTYGAGLAMLDENDGLQLFSKQEVLRARDINDIDEDAEGNIWIATEGEGFFKYANKEFLKIGDPEMLLSPFIKGIQYDPTGRIWFSYRKGLGYVDLKTEKKYHFTRRDGLLDKEAYSSAIIVDSKANKWFCNDYGVTLFEHDTVSATTRPLETFLTGIRIFFKDYPVDLSKNHAVSGVDEIKPLNFNHDQNHLTFDYVAIKLNRTGKIYYRHMLQGYDAQWSPPETANFVTYTNLDPGKYILKIQATDDLGAWVDPVAEYAFVITPPYWRRTWFYLLQIVSVVVLFSLTYLIGKRGVSTKRYVLRLMLFSSFFITLEYVENFVDPLVSGFFGGAPVFRFFLNFLLALLLLPVETLITHWLMGSARKSDDTQQAAEPVADREEVVEDEHV